MIDTTTPLGVQLKTLYDMWNVKMSCWPSDSDYTHIEFEPTEFNPKDDNQIKLLASICYNIQTGLWHNSISVLAELIPDQELESHLGNAMIEYFSANNFSTQEEKKDHFEKQRNPFILEVMAHIMLHAVEEPGPHPLLKLRAVQNVHLDSKRQGLDVAALVEEPLNKEFYLVIGEAKNRKTPSQGTSEALEAFRKHENGETWPDIRQVMRTIANVFDHSNNLSRSISQWGLWKNNFIYRITIEHKTQNPQRGSQFCDFATYTPNVKIPSLRQCEAFSTGRLTSFYDQISNTIVEYIKQKEETNVVR